MHKLKWYSWIPTNLGILDYKFITHSQMSSNFGKNIKISEDKNSNTLRYWNLDLKNFKDSLSSYLTVSKGKEIIPMGTISFSPASHRTLQGIVTINFSDSFRVQFHYRLNIHGKVCIYNPSFQSYKIQYIDKSYFDIFAQITYMIIKQSLHGDSHHHQKIDYVLKVQADTFPVDAIIYTFAKHIKNVERDIKSLDTCIGHLKALNAIEEIRGYISYSNTFYELHRDSMSSSSKTIVKNMKNVVSSLEATVAKKHNHFTYLDTAKTTILTIFTIITSLLLLLFKKSITDNISVLGMDIQIKVMDDVYIAQWYVVVLSIFIFGFFIFYWLRKCYIKSYIFYKHYTLYEEYKYISWLSLKDASFKHYLIKIIIPISIISISLYFLAYAS